ncbi:MAG: serine/threonine-protein phosphatase [Acidobacteria bacterium]|nr:serine/threonine-protein phosphatase [Acidobacteriota bacterium]MBV9146647.1 serine/threonine-protein phosphatase [Acidobacteriota bacterium]
MKLSFQRAPVKSGLRIPQPSVLPAKPDLSVSARYKGSRIGGDYYDFFPITDTRMIFMLTDVAGKREEALHIAAAVQDKMRERAPELLADPDANVAEGVTKLVLELNRTIMATAEGVRSAPTFLGCLDEQFGLIHYVSAGHTPAFVKSDGEVTQLDPNGLPLGLFSHATHDAQVSVAQPGSAIVLVSKGLVETSAGRQEFGIQRVRASLEEQSFASAHDLCHDLLERAVKFGEQPSAFGPHLSLPGFRGSEPNDQTVVCLMRTVQSETAYSATA